jgi:hypothetical protein
MDPATGGIPCKIARRAAGARGVPHRTRSRCAAWRRRTVGTATGKARRDDADAPRSAGLDEICAGSMTTQLRGDEGLPDRVHGGATAAAERPHARLPGLHHLGDMGERAHDRALARRTSGARSTTTLRAREPARRIARSIG